MKENCPIFCDGYNRIEKLEITMRPKRMSSLYIWTGQRLHRVWIGAEAGRNNFCHHIESLRSTYDKGDICTCDFEGWPICVDFRYLHCQHSQSSCFYQQKCTHALLSTAFTLVYSWLRFKYVNDDLLLGFLLILFLANIQRFGLRDVFEIGFDSPLLEKDAHGRLLGHPQHVSHVRYLQHHGGE